MSAALTVADVFRAHSDDFLKAYGTRIPGYQKKALFALMRCRTPSLGGHLYVCPVCGYKEQRYNSCRVRGCPQCEGSKEAAWLLEREAELLPTHYFHVVFTLPHILNTLILGNQHKCLGLFFSAVAKTLMTVAQNRLGGRLGFFSVLHTWGQKLDFHPHLHCVVPGGVVLPDGAWLPTSKRRRYFLPHKVLADVFQGIFIEKLRRAFQARSLTYQGDFEALLTQAACARWVVHAQPPFGSALSVLKYLSRYTRKVALANSRLISLVAATVTFSWKDYADGSQRKLCRMSAVEFIRRFLMHIPQPGFVRIRHYGFMAGKGRAVRLATLRETILGLLPPVVLPKTDRSFKPGICPGCGMALLVAVLELASSRKDSS